MFVKENEKNNINDELKKGSMKHGCESVSHYTEVGELIFLLICKHLIS